MAASDELPRGITIAVVQTGSVSSFTIPACLGITHVLTEIDGLVESFNGAAAQPPFAPHITITTSGGTYTAYQLLQCCVPQTAAADELESGTDTWQGKIAGEAGASIVVAFDSTAANFTETLRVTWYDE